MSRIIIQGMTRVAIINRLESLLKQLDELDGCEHRLSCMKCGWRLGASHCDFEKE